MDLSLYSFFSSTAPTRLHAMVAPSPVDHFRSETEYLIKGGYRILWFLKPLRLSN
jgi:hypothetical protein